MSALRNDKTDTAESLAAAGIRVVTVAGLSLALLVASVAVWTAASRGLDLTDEGIYLVTYRAFRSPEQTFTGSPALLGPLFQLLGWDIVALRRVKLIAFVVVGGALGAVVERFVRRRTAGIANYPRFIQPSFVLLTSLGALTVYAFLPQTPSYNDLSILLAMIAIAVTVRSIDERFSASRAVTLGLVGMLLFFVKFPSAVLIGGACLAALVVCRCGSIPAFLRTLAVGLVVGGFGGLVVLQVLGGDVVARFSALRRSSATAIKGQELSESYGRVYVEGLEAVFRQLVGPTIVLLSLLALSFVAHRKLGQRRPVVTPIIHALAALTTLVLLWQRGLLTGGPDNVLVAQATFPILAVATLLLALAASRMLHTEPQVDGRHGGQRDCIIVISLLVAAPTLQGIGSGNSPFVLAIAAGALWTAGLLALLLLFVPHAGPMTLTGLSASGVLALSVFALGAPALWLRPFRVAGDLRDQTSVVLGVPRLAGIHTDAGTAAFLTEAHQIMKENGALGRPGFSSFAGVGMAYALELSHPPSGMYVDEALARPLRARIDEACSLGTIRRDRLPVVLTESGMFPETEAGLQACGVDFPASYREFSLTAPPYLRQAGMANVSMWIPSRLPA